MTKRTLLISIPVVALVLNGVGYLIVSKVRSPPVAVAPPIAAPAPPAPVLVRPPREEPDPAVTEEFRAKEERAMARRVTGLAALEGGDYDKALTDFTEARELLGEKAHVGELIRVTEDLRSRPPSSPRSRSGGSRRRHSSGRRVAYQEEPAGESPAPPAAAPSGLLIVTTTPRGLLVHVDDTAIDLTPMRAKVKPGLRRITLLDGDHKVYETSLEIKEGATATLLKDLSVERAAVEPARLAAGPPAAASGREESSRPTSGGAASGGAAEAPSPSADPPAAPAARPAAASRRVDAPIPASTSDRAAASPSETGELDIASPGLYGVVWINGRPRGYPPLKVRDLPPGPAKIEIRVNGVQRRTLTVLVKPGLTTPVKMRSQETAP